MRYLVAAPPGTSPAEVERLAAPVAAELRARIVRRRVLPLPPGSLALDISPGAGQVPLVVIATPASIRVEVLPGADDWSRQRAAAFARRLGELLSDA